MTLQPQPSLLGVHLRRWHSMRTPYACWNTVS